MSLIVCKDKDFKSKSTIFKSHREGDNLVFLGDNSSMRRKSALINAQALEVIKICLKDVRC